VELPALPEFDSVLTGPTRVNARAKVQPDLGGLTKEMNYFVNAPSEGSTSGIVDRRPAMSSYLLCASIYDEVLPCLYIFVFTRNRSASLTCRCPKQYQISVGILGSELGKEWQPSDHFHERDFQYQSQWGGLPDEEKVSASTWTVPGGPVSPDYRRI
jgi:hypothetical protein